MGLTGMLAYKLVYSSSALDFLVLLCTFIKFSYVLVASAPLRILTFCIIFLVIGALQTTWNVHHTSYSLIRKWHLDNQPPTLGDSTQAATWTATRATTFSALPITPWTRKTWASPLTSTGQVGGLCHVWVLQCTNSLCCSVQYLSAVVYNVSVLLCSVSVIWYTVSQCCGVQCLSAVV